MLQKAYLFKGIFAASSTKDDSALLLDDCALRCIKAGPTLLRSQQYAVEGICAQRYFPVMHQRLATLSAVSEPLRLRILALISAHGEVCVCQLTHATQASQPSVSKHLGVLRDAGLLAQRRDAQWMLYRIAELGRGAGTMLRGALDGIETEPQHLADLARMATAPDGPPASRSVANGA